MKLPARKNCIWRMPSTSFRCQPTWRITSWTSDGTDEVKSKYDSFDRHNNSGIVLMTEDSSEKDRIASTRYLTNVGEASLRTKKNARLLIREYCIILSW